MLQVVVEEAAQGTVDPLVLAARRRPQVDAVEHELAQPQHRAADFLALHDVAGLGGALDDVTDERVDPVRPGRAEQLDLSARQIGGLENPRPQRIVDVVVDVGDAVDQLDDPPLQSCRLARAGVVEDAVAHLFCEVEPRPSRSSASTTRSEWTLCLNSAPQRSRSAVSSASSPAWPKGGWPRS